MIKHPNGLRWILIHGMTRQQLINLIHRKENVYKNEDLEACSLTQLRDLAIIIDKKHQKKRMEGK